MSFIPSLTKIQAQLNQLEQAFLQSQKNQVPITAKTDQTANNLVVADTNIEQNTVDIERNTADIDYIVMMADIDIPIEDEDEDAEASSLEELEGTEPEGE